MCGICGLVTNAFPVDRQEIEWMTESLKHRGPDDCGYFINSTVAFGHRRLSIIDLSQNGHQPMANEDNTVQLVFNGEIYNFQEIRKQLERKNHQFKSSSDSEVIVHAYEEWGTNCFSHFNGMFAIAIWDENEKELILARDRIGKKPLYYYWDEKNILFGSELKALQTSNNFQKEISLAGFQLYIQFGYIPAPYTIFEKAWKVPAGSYLRFRNGKIQIDKYWDLSKKLNFAIPENETLEKAEEVLTEAVQYRLISDVPIGFFLSSGIDSTMITAIATQITDKVKTFTIGVDDPRYNEAIFARKIADYLGTDHTEYYVTERDFLKFIPESVHYFDEPFADSSLLPTYYVSRLTSQSVKVALSGDGGDELFGGYPKYNQIRLAQYLKYLPQSSRKRLFKLIHHFPHDNIQKISEALQFNHIDELLIWMTSIWKPNELAQILSFPMSKINDTPIYNNYGESAEVDPILKMMRIDLQMFLCEDILVKVDRASMANSLETRAPLLDYRFVEFINSVPLSIRMKNNQSKYLIKKLLLKYVSQQLWDRPKRGFSIPVASWLRHELNDFFNDYVNEKKIKEIGLLSWDSLSSFIDGHIKKGRHFPQKLFSILIFNLWYSKYFEGN